VILFPLLLLVMQFMTILGFMCSAGEYSLEVFLLMWKLSLQWSLMQVMES